MSDTGKTKEQLILELKALQRQNTALELALQGSERRRKEAEEVANVGSWEMDVATGDSRWSDEFFRICGFEPGAFAPTAEKGFELIHPEDRERAAAGVQQAIEETSEYNIEKRIVRPDGSVRTVLSKGRVVCDETGAPLKLVGTFADITERKIAELALRKSEARFRLIAEHSADLITVFRNKKIEYVSPAVERLLGYSQEEFLQLDHLELIHPANREKIAHSIDEHVDNQITDPVTYEYRQKHKNGAYRWFRTHGWEKIIDGANLITVLNTRDITEQKQAEQSLQKSEAKLRAANAAKDKFFTIVAHDLKNPMIAVVSGTRMLKDRLQHSDDEYLGRVSRELFDSTQRLSKFLENLLAWSRIEQNLTPYHPVKVELYVAANYSLSLLRESAAQKDITLTCSIGRETMVRADYNMLSAIFRNLVSNAIKFSSAGDTVNLDAVRKNNQVEIAVIDPGVGMGQDKVQQLFKIGEKDVSSIGTAGETGTGLGLVLCKGFVERMGGEIWAESQLGEGCAVRFTLPEGG